MEEEFRELLKDFKNIEKIDYTQTTSKYKNGSGITLEKLLQSTGGDFCIPDFKGIELKTVRCYPQASIDLFNCSPDGKYIYPTQWLAANYGYPDKDFKNTKVLKGEVSAKQFNKIGLFYYYKLQINKKEKKIILEIYNYKYEKINADIYWDFESIKSKLEIKLQKLALIDTRKYFANNRYYHIFETIRLYKLKSFDKFIEALENGIINITFKVGLVKKGKSQGKIHDHGTSFRIQKNNIETLFTRVY